MMTIQAHSDSLLPKACGKSSCVQGGVAVYFYATLCLLALGAGGVKGALPALGADQFDPKNPKEAKSLASYFNWLLLSSVAGSSIGVTVVVYVATNKNNQNWWKGFLITAVAAFVGYIFLLLGKPFYRLHVPKDSPLLRLIQVINSFQYISEINSIRINSIMLQIIDFVSGYSCGCKKLPIVSSRES